MSEADYIEKWPDFLYNPPLIAQRLATLIASECRKVTREEWTGEGEITSQGELCFRFLRSHQAVEFIWYSGKGLRYEGIPGAFAIHVLSHPGSESAIQQALVHVLRRIMTHPGWNALSPEWSHTFLIKNSFFVALKLFLSGRPIQWYQCSLASLSEDGEHVRLLFKSGTSSVEFLVGKKLCELSSTPPFWQGKRLSVAKLSDSRKHADGKEDNVERLLVFLFHRFEQGLLQMEEDSLAKYFHPAATAGQWFSCTNRHHINEVDSLPYWELFGDAELREDSIYKFDHRQDIIVIGLLHRYCVFENYPFDSFGPTIPPFHSGVVTRKLFFSTAQGTLAAYAGADNIFKDSGLSTWKSLLEKYDKEDNVLLVSAESCFNKLLGIVLDAPNKTHHLKIHTSCVAATPGADMYTDNETPLTSIYTAFMKEAADCKKTDDPSINLVGFPEQIDSDELSDELGQIGIRINARLVPQASADDARHFNAAWGQCLSLDYRFIRTLFPSFPVDVIDVPLPYGFAATKRWLSAIARHVRLSDAYQRYEAEISPALNERLLFWQERARHLPIGFVIDISTISKLLDPWRNHGLSPLLFLVEFGFPLVIYYHPIGDKENETALAENYLRKGLELFPNSSMTFSTFTTYKEYSQKLASGTTRLFFSDQYFNEEIHLAGGSLFSLNDFEKGFKGAERTLKRLWGRSQSPYWEKYSETYNKNLARPFEWEQP